MKIRWTWIFSAHILLIPLLMVFIDEPLTTSFNDRKPTWYVAFNRTITDVALGQWYFAGALLGMLLIAVFLKFRSQSLRRPQLERAKAWFQFLLASLFVSGTVLLTIKHLVGRARPFVVPEHDPLLFKPLTADWNFHSFPSGHAQVIWTVAFALVTAFPKWKPVFILMALVISFSRVVIHDHFLSDILAGGSIGYFVSAWLYDKVKTRLYFNFASTSQP